MNNISKFYQAIEKVQKLKRSGGKNYGCLNPQCRSGADPIGSHSVSRQFLEAISENQHFLEIVPVTTGNPPNLEFEFNKISEGKASRFRGFCPDCDTGLFAPFERNPLSLTREHLFLLSLRSIFKEYHSKKSMVDLMTTEMPEVASGIHSLFEKERLKCLTEYKEEYSRILREKSYADVEHHCYVFDSNPVVLASSVFVADMLPTNRSLEKGRWEMIAINWVPYLGGSVCVLSYLRSKSKNPSIFSKSIMRLRPEDVWITLFLTLLDHCENFFMRASSYESLSEEELSALRAAFTDSMDNPLGFMRYPCLQDYRWFRGISAGGYRHQRI